MARYLALIQLHLGEFLLLITCDKIFPRSTVFYEQSLRAIIILLKFLKFRIMLRWRWIRALLESSLCSRRSQGKISLSYIFRKLEILSGGKKHRHEVQMIIRDTIRFSMYITVVLPDCDVVRSCFCTSNLREWIS